MTQEFKPEPKTAEISAESTSLSQEIPPTDKRRMLPTPSELIDLLSRRVIGQTQAKRALATAVYQHFMCCARSDLHGGRVEAENHVMLLGPSGCGKSLLLRTLGDVVLKVTIFYGLIPEFVGRFSRIATLDPLDESALRRILTEAEGNVLARRRDFFAMHGVRLEFTNEAIDELVAKALVQGTGARALRQVVDQILRGVEHRLPDMATAGVNALVIDGNAVNGRSQRIEHMGVKKDLPSLLEIRRHAAYAKQEDIKDEDGDDLCTF